MKKIYYVLLTILIALALVGCRKNNNKAKVEFTGENVKLGQSFTILGETKRQEAIIADEGNRYPTYGTSLKNITDEEKTNLINEANYLKSSSSTYDKMDEDGNLYLNDVLLDRKLYKHTTALNNYYGTPDDNEAGVIKKIDINATRRGNYITGLYAPAGEVIKIELSDEDLIKTGGVKIEIGQYSENNQLNNIWAKRDDFSRMPLMGNEMEIATKIGYVGSFLGGPIYVTPNNKCEFSVTISNALEYCHFIYGLTTKEEFERLKNTSSPYFDLEVWDSSVRHSGPKKYVNLDYNNLMKISKLWLSISNISKQIPSGSAKDIGITFIYDPFVAAGSAVAFVGRNWCNLPPSWMSESLDYEKFTTNGSWGAIHEYNHHFQRYGFNPGDEVTNNALSLLSYINYTNISANRPNLVSWNRYLDPKTSLTETLNQASKNETSSSLNTYADIIHTFGVDTFIKAAKAKNGAGGADNWYEALCEATGYNMEYYFSLINQSVSDELKAKYNGLPLYIPIALKEQTGRVINKNNIITVKPYKIKANTDYTIDLDENLVLPNGFSYKINKVSKPANGKIKTNGNVITYTPNKTNSSGQINLELTITNKELKYNNKQTIIFELQPKYMGIDATRYSYDKALYTNIDEAIENNFAGYTSSLNEQINKHFVNGIKNNEIYIYHGKIYMPNDGEYKIGVRTSKRSNTLLELGLNTSTYTDKINSLRTNPVDVNNNYLTYSVKNGDYIYFKMIIQSFDSDGFAELYGGYNELKTIDNSYLYNDLAYKPTSFEFNDAYPKEYLSNSYAIPLANQKIISYTSSYKEWDNNYKIENIIDGNQNTSYHSIKGKLITSEPFALTIDLGKSYLVNTLNITAYNGNESHSPKKLKLYGGDELNNLELINEYQDLTPTNRLISLSFKETKLRYYKVVIEETATNRYVALSEINMTLNTKGKLINPSMASYYVTKNQSFSKEYQLSTFGFIIKGNGSIVLNTTNKAFGIITKNQDSKMKITIDGKSEIVEFDNIYYLEFNENKKIEIEILDNDLLIDSFIL